MINRTGLPYIEKDGFGFFTGYKPFEMFLMDSERLEACVDYCKAKNITDIMLTDAYGFKGQSISFLDKLNVKRLAIKNSDINDIGLIHQQKNLLYLNLVMQYDMQDIDFNNFTMLETFSGDWSPALKNLFSCKSLKELSLWKYKSKAGNAHQFKCLHLLENLRIVQSNLKSLDGFEEIKTLRSLGLYYNLSLEGFYDVKLNPDLRKLIIQACKKLEVSRLGDFTHLVHLEIINNGKINSLDIINKMPELEFLQFTEGEITEPDNTYMIRHPKLKEIVLTNKKHYRLKQADINKVLSDRYKTGV